MYKYISFFLISWIYTTNCIAENQDNISVNVLSNYKIKINYMNKIYKINVNHSIDGYNIDCDKKNMVIWGRSKLFNPDNPQNSYITIVKINPSSIKKEMRNFGNIYDVLYLKNKPIIYIETGMGAFANLTDGSLLKINGLDVESPDVEDCPDFVGKSYKRYSE